jgi:hypothetical protein
VADKLKPWGEYVELLRSCGDLASQTWEPDSEQVRGEVYRQLFMNASLGYFMYFQSDTGHPEWTPFLNSVFLLQPNPDDVYYLAFIRGDSTYRIIGDRGTVHKLTFTIGTDMMGMQEAQPRNLGEHEAEELEFDAQGRFEVILSTNRPSDCSGNWWHLDPKASFVVVRLRSYDWGNEVDPRLAIERVGSVPLKERMTPEQTDVRLQGLLGFTERLTRIWLAFLNDMRARGIVNQFELTKFEDWGCIKVQVYWRGIFEILPGEALLLETELPDTRPYWNIQLADSLWNQLELVYRQTSLNGHQARIDSDGRFRAVLSLEDPGVPNWLDTAGHRLGTMVGRWYDCSSTPLPTLKKVKLSGLRQHLPHDTPVVQPAERQAVLRDRCRGAQFRRRW